MLFADEQWAEEQRRRANIRRRREQPVGEQLLIDDVEEDVEEQEVGNEGEAENHEIEGPDHPHPLGQGAQGQGVAVLNAVGRRVRGAEEEQGDVASRLRPAIPGPCEGEPLVDADGWREIDRLSAWECEMNIFTSMEEVPPPFEVGWGKAATRVLTVILNAPDQEQLDRALKWWLILPAALLRQARRGGQNGRGRAEVAARFRAAAEGDWGFLITSLRSDRAKEVKRRETESRRAARPARSEEEIMRLKRKAALVHLSKGQVSKAVSRLTSHGVADTRNPTVMAALKSKYIARSRELPASVTMGQPVDNVAGLKDALLNLGTGTSPGTGGMRPEFLITLAEVMEE